MSTSTSGQDKPWIAVDNTTSGYYSHPGRIYTSWTGFDLDGYNRIYFRHADEGNAFSPAQVLAEFTTSVGPAGSLRPQASNHPKVYPDQTKGYLQGPMPAVASDGTVYLAYMFYDGTNPGAAGHHNIIIRSSTDGGVTFPTTLTGPGFTYSWLNYGVDHVLAKATNIPSLAIDPTDPSILYLAFADGSTDGTYRTHIKFAASVDGGESWSTYTLPQTSYYDFHPSISIDANHRISIVYHAGPTDDPDDPSFTQAVMSTYLTEFTYDISAHTFVYLVKTPSSNYHIEIDGAPQTSSQEFSVDYLSSVSVASMNKVSTILCDTRDGNQDVSYANLSNINTSLLANKWYMTSIPTIVYDFTKFAIYTPENGPVVKKYTSSGYVDAPNPLVNSIGYFSKVTVNVNPFMVGKPLYSSSSAISAGWNMIGSITQALPVTKLATSPAGIITSSVYGYTPGSGYYVASSITPGSGYWVKVAQSGALVLDPTSGDGPIGSCIPPPRSPQGEPAVPVPSSPASGATGQPTALTLSWGSADGATTYGVQYATNPSLTGAITTTGLNSPSIDLDGLSNATTYYWRVNATNSSGTSLWSCIFNFATVISGGGGCGTCCASSVQSLDQFTVTDATGSSQAMYAANGGRGLHLGFTDYAMPPETPRGVFHARFGSGKFIESIPPTKAQTRIPIKIKDAKYPLTLGWNLRSENSTRYWLGKPGNGQSQIELTGAGSIALASTSSDGIFITAISQPPPCGGERAARRDLIKGTPSQPSSYALQQNMPNPFNPATLVNYELPEPSHVTLKVYNMLGQEVATLVDGMQDAGYRTARFDGSNLASGIYMYRLTALPTNGGSSTGGFSDVKKMMLVK